MGTGRQSEVVVTGIGALLPNCDRRETFWRHLRDGESQLRFQPEPGNPSELCAMGEVSDFDPDHYLAEIPERFYRHYPRELQLYLASVLLARDDAKLDFSKVVSDRVGLFDGSARTTFQFWYDRIRSEAEQPIHDVYSRRDLAVGLPGQTVGVAASLFGIRGPTYAFSGTCSSGAIAIGHAMREIRSGELDLAIAGGHECSLVPPLYAIYRDANLLSAEREDARRAVRPYVGHSTNAFGEGAVTLVLESRAHAEARGVRPIATLCGYQHGNNGYHPTTVDIDGVRPAEVIEALLRRTGTAKEEIGFVVGHGNAVQLSDVSEERYMRRLFGARAVEVPLVSTKPIYGHTLGASSALNIAAAALMLDEHYVIPTINIRPEDTRPGTNHQAGHGLAIDRAHPKGLAVSYGMGGHNAIVLLGRA